jgi:hypothetical protein
MRVKRLLIGFVLLTTGLATLAGCGRSPQTTFYTLTPLVSEATTLRPAVPSIAIAAVTLPDLVDRPQLVVQNAGTKVAILETHRWAEPLKTAIPRLLAENLSRLIGSDRVAAYPQHAANGADYRLFVDIQRFEVVGNTVVVDALWSMRPAGGGKAVTRRSRLTEPVERDDYDALAAAYSRALGSLAREIARAVSSL